MARKKKSNGHSNSKRIKCSNDCDQALRKNDWKIVEGKGSHRKGRGPNGESITYYESKEYPAGTSSMLTRIFKTAGLLGLIAVIMANWEVIGPFVKFFLQ